MNFLSQRLRTLRLITIFSSLAFLAFTQGAKAGNIAPLSSIKMDLPGNCDYYNYAGSEGGLEADAEAFWSAHAVCGGLNCGAFNATVNFSTQGFSWFWQSCNSSTKFYTKIPCPDGYAQSGSVCVQNATVPAKNPSCGLGNPCNPTTGDKFQEENLFTGSGPGALSFKPTFHSAFQESGVLGLQWHDNFSYPSISVGTGGGLSTARVRRPDGRFFFFTLTAGVWTPDADINDRLEQTGSGWTYSLRNGAQETYNSAGKLTAVIDANGLTQTLTYNVQGRLASVTDAFGHTLLYTYNSSGLIDTVTQPDGGVITLSYTALNLTRVQFPDGSAKLYHYENTTYKNYLTGISYQEPGASAVRYSTYTYDATGKAATTQHTGGIGKYTFIYNSTLQSTVKDAINTTEVMNFSLQLGIKNLTSKTNQSDGKTLVQTFDTKNNKTCQKDEEGRVTTYVYNATNQKTSMTEGRTGTCAAPVTTSATRTTIYAYVSPTLDLPTSITSPSVYSSQNMVTTIAYTDTNHPTLPTQITQSGYTPTGANVARTVTMTYNSAGQVTSIDGPRTDVNDITILVYNTCASGYGCGQLSSIMNAAGHVTTFNNYDANGRLLQQTDANGLMTSYQYDARGRVTYITHTPTVGPARVTHYTYTAAGDIASVTFPDNRTLTYTYDAAKLLTRVTDNQGNYVAYTYDLKGNKTGEKTYDLSNTLVRQLDLTYDARNKLSQINAAGSITRQVNDALGNLTQVTDPKSNPPTQNSFDALNRLTQTINSLSGVTTYTYDANDKLKQVTTPNSATTQYSVDDLGNVLSETSNDRGTTTYTYDSAGNLKTQTDARGIIATFTYDALNRITVIDYPSTAEDMTYTYDSCINGTNKLCQTTDQSGATSYAYDNFGNVAQQQKTELGILYTTSYTYDAANRVSSITYPDNRIITYTRDTLGRISSVTATVNGSGQSVLTSRSYRADHLLAGQTFGNGINETRQYDLQGRLTNQFIGSVDTRIYGYDANGNITSIQSLPQVGSYNYDALDRLIMDGITSTPTSSVTFNYDANGNRTSDGTNTYVYASNSNRLASVGGASITVDSAGNITNDGTKNYAYNNIGQVSAVTQGSTTLGTYTYNHAGQRTRKVAGSTTTVYHYDTSGNLILETTSTATTNVVYINADAQPLAQINKNGGTDTVTYLHTDHQGTVRLGTDLAQNPVYRFEGRAFGNTQPTGSVTVNLAWTGTYRDTESSLYLNGARYFDAKNWRFLTPDPMSVGEHAERYMDELSMPGQVPFDGNPYARVLNNPWKWIDPTGFDTTSWNNTAGGRSRLDGPTNGNWGGKCWSGGQYSCGPNVPGNASPTDSADQCYQRHDNCYVTCARLTDSEAIARCVASCNRTLVNELGKLPDDPRTWPKPPRPGTEGDSRRYRNYAIRYFK